MFYSREDVNRIQKALSEGKTINEALYGDELDYAYTPAALYECLERIRRSFSLIKTIFALIKKEKSANETSCADCLTTFMKSDRLVSNYQFNNH
ncbi:MAG: hypothetical protein AAGU27_18250 [Dehalobacterium sp.]